MGEWVRDHKRPQQNQNQNQQETTTKKINMVATYTTPGQPAWEVLHVQRHRFKEGVPEFRCKWTVEDASYFTVEQLGNIQV